jgi:segregation and condensation protein A
MLSSIDTVSSPLDVRLEKYEGPLDLLLDLIRRQQIDIRDIPIAMITSQYLAYLDKARELDIDLGAEFVFMAATLIHIKSKMLLPSDPALAKPGAEDQDDPRSELVSKLLEHERFKNAAEMLQQKRMVEENVWSNPQIKEFIAEDEDPGLAISLFDLVKAFNEVLDRAKSRPTYEVASEEVSVEDMVRHLRSLLQHTKKDKPLFIMEVIEKQRTRRAMICLFLAVLEMVKLHAIEFVQKDLFGEIAVKRGEDFDSVFSGEQPSPAIEEEYK